MSTTASPTSSPHPEEPPHESTSEKITIKKPEYAFTITCKIGSDSEEERVDALRRNIQSKERKRRKLLKEDENSRWILSKDDKLLNEHSTPSTASQSAQRSKTGVKIIQPFQYDSLKVQAESSGVIYLEKPQAREYQNKRVLKEFFSHHGAINRIEPDFILKGKKKIIKGYHIEFAEKEVAQRVALTLNGAPISRRDSRTLIMRYVPDFSWSSVQDEYSKKLMLRKLMRAQATNELKAIQTYEKRRKLSHALKKQKKTKKRNNQPSFAFAQNKFRDYVTKDSNHHLDFMSFLGNDESSESK